MRVRHDLIGGVVERLALARPDEEHMLPNSFTDALNRVWIIAFNTDTLRRLRKLADGFTLDSIMAPTVDPAAPDAPVNQYQAFLNDILRFGDVLYAILQPDIDKAGVAQVDFEKAMDGPALQRAKAAFHGAFTDFSGPPRSLLLRGIKVDWERTEAAMQKAMTVVMERLNSGAGKIDDAELEKRVNAAIDERLRATAGTLAG